MTFSGVFIHKSAMEHELSLKSFVHFSVAVERTRPKVLSK